MSKWTLAEIVPQCCSITKDLGPKESCLCLHNRAQLADAESSADANGVYEMVRCLLLHPQPKLAGHKL